MDLKTTIQQVEGLPSPDFVLQQIVETASSPSASAKELNEVASKDPGFVSKILKLANSAYYGLPRRVAKLTDAIMILGFKTVRNIAMSIFAGEEFFKFQSSALDIRDMWSHSIAVALTAETISERIGYSNKEEMFMCGLLHDIGKTVQGILFPQVFDGIVNLAKEKEMPYYEVEKKLDIPTHEVFAEYLLEKWNFPEVVLISAARHHRPLSLGQSIYSDALYIVHMSTFICERLEFGNNGSGAPISLKKEVWDELGFTTRMFVDVVDIVRSRRQKIQEFMNL